MTNDDVVHGSTRSASPRRDAVTIRPYDETRWSLLADAQRAAIEPSMQLLEGLHARWVYLIRALPPEGPRRSNG
jgi:hypothetical protein